MWHACDLSCRLGLERPKFTFLIRCNYVQRFYAALKGHGATTRLVILPHESHSYTARESVLHTLAETDDWLRSYCESVEDKASQDLVDPQSVPGYGATTQLHSLDV